MIIKYQHLMLVGLLLQHLIDLEARDLVKEL